MPKSVIGRLLELFDSKKSDRDLSEIDMLFDSFLDMGIYIAHDAENYQAMVETINDFLVWMPDEILKLNHQGLLGVLLYVILKINQIPFKKTEFFNELDRYIKEESLFEVLQKYVDSRVLQVYSDKEYQDTVTINNSSKEFSDLLGYLKILGLQDKQLGVV